MCATVQCSAVQGVMSGLTDWLADSHRVTDSYGAICLIPLLGDRMEEIAVSVCDGHSGIVYL